MALRIKSNVDLKELEKYGFLYKEPVDDLWYSYYFTPDDSLVINYSDREIDFDKEEINYKTFDYLYDLIKDDLVEKVDD